MTTRTENGFSKLQIDKTTTRIMTTTTIPTTITCHRTLLSFFAAAAPSYPSSPHLLHHALPPLLPRHLLRLLILYIVCHRLIPRNHLQTPPVPSLCCYCSPSPWIHLLLKLLSFGHKRPSSIAGLPTNTTNHQSPPSSTLSLLLLPSSPHHLHPPLLTLLLLSLQLLLLYIVDPRLIPRKHHLHFFLCGNTTICL